MAPAYKIKGLDCGTYYGTACHHCHRSFMSTIQELITPHKKKLKKKLKNIDFFKKIYYI
jgi:hypothetical protein